jgi:glutathione S-transferase
MLVMLTSGSFASSIRLSLLADLDDPMDNQYVLFWGPDMGSLPVQALLLELSLPFRMQQVNFGHREQRNPEYLGINPTGKVPALRMPSGEIMTESAAMLIYLADLHPDLDLLPTTKDPRRAQALRWLLYMATEMYPTACHYYEPTAYAGNKDAAGNIALKGKQSFHAQCCYLETQMDPGQIYFLGDNFTAVDLYLSTMLDWHSDKSRLAVECPKISVLADCVRARPAMQTARQTHKMNNCG